MAKRIDAKNLNIYYGKFLAVSDCNFTIAPRSVTAFIGPSGCGKSTVLRTLNRMHEVIAGARGRGRGAARRRQHLRRRRRPGRRPAHDRHGVPAAQPVPDDVDLRQRRRRAEAAKRPQATKAELDDVVEKSLRGANLWEEVKDRLDKPGAGLSGGQQQRLCIARAIAVEPQVLLMDEPCSALDPISTLAIEDLIQTLKEKYTIVIVTHNMQQAARVCERTAFFNLAGSGQARAARRDGRHREDLLQPDRQAHRGLHLRPLRLERVPRSVPAAEQGHPERA